MDIRAWTGMQLLLVIVAYLLVLGLGWLAYTRRPGLAERQAAARAASPAEVGTDEEGQTVATFTGTVNLTPAIILIVVPPVLAIIVWLFGSRA